MSSWAQIAAQNSGSGGPAPQFRAVGTFSFPDAPSSNSNPPTFSSFAAAAGMSPSTTAPVSMMPAFASSFVQTAVVSRKDGARSGPQQVRLGENMTIMVGVLVLDDNNRVLMVEEEEEDGVWYVPSAELAPNDDIQQVAVQETKRLSGLDVEVVGVASVESYPASLRHNWLRVMLAARLAHNASNSTLNPRAGWHVLDESFEPTCNLASGDILAPLAAFAANRGCIGLPVTRSFDATYVRAVIVHPDSHCILLARPIQTASDKLVLPETHQDVPAGENVGFAMKRLCVLGYGVAITFKGILMVEMDLSVEGKESEGGRGQGQRLTLLAVSDSLAVEKLQAPQIPTVEQESKDEKEEVASSQAPLSGDGYAWVTMEEFEAMYGNDEDMAGVLATLTSLRGPSPSLPQVAPLFEV